MKYGIVDVSKKYPLENPLMRWVDERVDSAIARHDCELHNAQVPEACKFAKEEAYEERIARMKASQVI